MKLSAKKRGQIYDLVHQEIRDLRINLRENYLPTIGVAREKVDFQIAQLEIPLAQKLMRLLDKDYAKEFDKH